MRSAFTSTAPFFAPSCGPLRVLVQVLVQVLVWGLAPVAVAAAEPLEGCPANATATGAPVTSQAVLAELGIAPDSFGIMLWRFHGERGEGHVFGTVHLGPPLLTRGPPQALLAIRASDVFASELIMDAAAQSQFMERARVAEDATAPISEATLGSALFVRYNELARRRGIPAEVAARLTPWAAFLSIGRPPIPPGSSLDEVLQQAAERMQRKVVGLQGIDELLAALESLSPSDHIAILADTICQQEALGSYYRQLLQVYSSGEPEAVAAFSRAGREEDPVMNRLQARMVTQRNSVFVKRIVELLELGSVFVAVGAQHLPGPEGVLQGLMDAGFQVDRVR